MRMKSLQVLGTLSPSMAPPVFEAVASDRTAPTSLRVAALAGLFESNLQSGMTRLAEFTADGQRVTRLEKEAAIELAPAFHFHRVSPKLREQFHTFLVGMADDLSDPTLADRALLRLAEMGDPTASAKAVAHLRDKKLAKDRQSVLLAAVSLRADRIAAPAMGDLLTQALRQNDEDTVIILLRLLAGDAATLKLRIDLIGKDKAVSPDVPASPRVQKAAFRSIMRETPEVVAKGLAGLEGILGNPNSKPLTLEAAGAFRVGVVTQGPFTAAQLDDWKKRVTKLHGDATDVELKLALAMALVGLDQAQK